jgi:alkylation response protein AidB-like acyl-CoA dehydrogenase
MRFDLNDQQREFQQAATDYLQAECPLARALMPHDSGQADLGIWRGLMSLGIGSLIVPEAYGGLGLGLLDLAVVAEVVGRFAAPGPFIEHALATMAIAKAGSDEQKDRWLPALASGELCATVALSEGPGSWRPESWSMRGDTVLTGTKRHVLHAGQADLIVVGLADGKLGIVERAAAGMTVTPLPCTDAGKQLAHVTFENTPLELLPRVVETQASQQICDAGLVLLAADAFGGASRCVQMSVEYAKLREQFGRPIGAFQAVKHQLADMALQVEPFVGMYWFAAHAMDTDPAAAPLAAALAKSQLCETYPLVARRMIEAHGGIGYTWEFGAHVWLKRALFDQAYLGMPQMQRARVAEMSGW